MATAEAIARYFLTLAAATDEPSPVTQMQLHKLLYYAHGWCLATRGRPLFAARFQAWKHGPVEAGLRPTFADYGAAPLALHEAADDGTLSGEDRGLVESVWKSYGKFSAWQLSNMTHREPPWKDARASRPGADAGTPPIHDEAIRAFFAAEQNARCKRMGLAAGALNAAYAQASGGPSQSLEEVRGEIRTSAGAG